MKMKKILAIIISILLLTSSFLLINCTTQYEDILDPYDDIYPIVETEYFVVQLRTDEGYAVVLELNEAGKQEEILAIPTYVEGMPVKEVGYLEYAKREFERMFYQFCAEYFV